MAFTTSDLYLASGTGTLYNQWVPYVTKHDTSSFYNFEQDNLPLFDLEDRTNELWEKLGHPIQNGFSGIPGVMFAVSADAPFAGESSGIIFKSVSAVIATLPEVITYPIIIEVASFGALGELNLQNIKFKDNGGLEIINRNFSNVLALSPDGLVAKLQSPRSLSSMDVFNTLHNASCLSISASVFSSTITGGDSRMTSNNVLCVTRSYGGTTNNPPTSALLVIRFGAAAFEDNAGTTGKYTFGAGSSVGYDSTYDLTVSSYDIIPTNALAGTVNTTTVRRNNNFDDATITPYAGVLYGNWFSKVSIKNCNGPLYIRNFAVDGGNGTVTTLVHTTLNGYEIDNSTVVIENALATRCKQTGFRISNSDVIFNRSIIAIRNYTLTDYQTRNDYKSTGIRCLNSNITVSSSQYVSGSNAVIHASWNKYGIELFNSRWLGGHSRKTYSNTSSMTHIQTCYNNDSGFKLNSSYLEVPGRLDCHNNSIGLESINSQIKLNEGTFEYNGSYGLKAEGSHIEYNQDLNRYAQPNANEPEGHMHMKNNGVNLLLDKSDLFYIDGNSLNSKYGQFYVYQTFGVAVDANGQKTSLPNMQVFNGSNLRIIKPYIYNRQTALATTLPIYGILAAVKNNSKATFVGTAGTSVGSVLGISVFIGPPNYSQQKHTAGIFADNASIVEFQGPTLICNNGVGVLAENESIINFNPPKDVHGNLLISSFDLSNALNHSKIEIHSTRACVVANKNSVINMHDLGSYTTIWPVSATSSTDYNLNNTFGIASAVSGGYMQFYPNGQEDSTVSAGRADINVNHAGIIASPIMPANGNILIDTTTATANASILGISTGGMCVRVMNGSIINVKNVNFPTGWDNTSGILYDSSGGNCDLLRIWNIGADSEMEASFLSVSSLYPSLAGYYGPSAVYISGAGPASAAPSWVPDTSTLSVLDDYGTSGSTIGKNYGPFRIYVSVDGPAKFLNYYTPAGLIYNGAYQAWSQGYNPSGSLSAAPQVSGYYKDLNVSTFKTTSAMIDPGYRSRIRLDESAADTFANSKNGAYVKSGRVPFCTIYRSGIAEGGEGFDTSAAGHGLGLLSVNIFDLSRVN